MKTKEFGVISILLGLFILCGSFFGIIGIAFFFAILGIISLIIGD